VRGDLGKHRTAVNQLTVARRARLAETFVERYDRIRQALGIADTYVRSVGREVQLAPEARRFHWASFLMGLVALLEAYMADVSTEFLVAFPGHIRDKQLTLDAIVNSCPVLGVIEEAAERAVRGVTYRRFSEFAATMLAWFDKSASFEPRLLSLVNEVKCTRDAYTHGTGVATSIYADKAGTEARVESGKVLPLSESYGCSALALVGQFVDEFHRKGPSRYLSFGKAKAMEEMWNATCLSRLVPFAKAWRVENENMVRPLDPDWLWSSSEEALYHFFLGIYNVRYPTRTVDAFEALRRWSPGTPESRVILSWMESPFWF
jgi:hypothetical protein